MYTKNESSRIKQAFWTTFGKYLSPVPSAEGLKINWINYKTGVKDVKFFLDADSQTASVGIKLLHKDIEIQQIHFEEFMKLSFNLEEYIGEPWDWHLHSYDNEGKIISKIFKELKPSNIYNSEDWPSIIAFLKPRIIALDNFWSDWKYGFEELQ